MKRNVFFLALEEDQRKILETLRHIEDLEIHGLLSVDTAVEAKDFSFNALLAEARKTLADFPGSIDAIIAQWDFPISILVPMLCHDYNIPSPSVNSVLKCEHKLWSRLVQREVTPEVVPRFCGIDPFIDSPIEQVTLDYPFWIKPVKAFSSHLGFKIENLEQFNHAIEEIRENIHQLGSPFNEVLDYADIPEEIKQLGGTACIAEEIIGGTQCAPEGSVFNGEFNTHGIIYQPNSVSKESLYDRLEYPSNLPEEIHHRVVDASKKILQHIGYNNGCFNAEFMWDENEDKLWLIELNTRISQSHSKIFVMVDGMSNHEIAVDIALGKRPSILNRQGVTPFAAKCYIPCKCEDGIVRSVPSKKQMKDIEKLFPHTEIKIDVEVGQRLSELMHQDSFCYRLGSIYLAGDSHEDIEKRFQYCLDTLEFDIEYIDQTIK